MREVEKQFSGTVRYEQMGDGSEAVSMETVSLGDFDIRHHVDEETQVGIYIAINIGKVAIFIDRAGLIGALTDDESAEFNDQSVDSIQTALSLRRTLRNLKTHIDSL